MADDRKRNRIAGQFAGRLIEMMESPAYRALSLSGHRVLSRIEIELARHGGKDNGKLPVAYEHFVEYGLHRRLIAPAIRELVALCFLEVTQKGCASAATFRRPSLYRLTYKPALDAADGTHEWRRIETLEQAEKLAESARKGADPNAVARARRNHRRPSLCPSAAEAS